MVELMRIVRKTWCHRDSAAARKGCAGSAGVAHACRKLRSPQESGLWACGIASAANCKSCLSRSAAVRN